MLVESELREGLTREQVVLAQQDWQAFQSGRSPSSSSQEGSQHLHWDWSAKANYFHGLLSYRFYSVECETQTQGLMLLYREHSCRIHSQRGKAALYVDYLAAAPWNQPALSHQPRYSGVGSVLMAAAVQASLTEGFQGRMGLHSLPQSEAFYRNNCLMTDLGPDASKQSLRYFEWTGEAAQEYLK